MKRKIIIANWKMYQSGSNIDEFVKIFKKLQVDANIDVDFVIAPSFLHLEHLLVSHIPNLMVAAQDAYFVDFGAYTGCVSYQQLAEYGVDYVIVGHSERRYLFKETDDSVNRKVLALLSVNISPIICVGETLVDFENQRTNAVLTSQLAQDLKNVEITSTTSEIIIAYEPIYAIGTGKIATPKFISEAVETIWNYIVETFGEQGAEKFRIVYGGSVNEKNIAGILAINHVSGALVGGASVKAEQFINILKEASL